MHLKKYDHWNIQKQSLNQRKNVKHINERDIAFIAIGENIGHEQSGKGNQFLRPVLIYKKFSSHTFLGIPLTRTQKSGKFYCTFIFKEKLSTAILSQIRLFDTKRVIYKCGRLDDKAFFNTKRKLIRLIR